jgi:hypothetical protein
MTGMLPRWARRGWRKLVARPRDSALAGVAVLATLYVVVYPFLQARYPPMTDLPFHAAEMSILRHYLDPSFQFREQFTIHPIEVPYVSMYAIGAVLALFMPVVWAAKLMAISMLLLLPLGLAVLFHGMKKTPLWGLLGLGLVWSKLSHWGWLNFVGSLGLYAMTVGAALLVLDQPTRRRKLLLWSALFAVFFTHVYRLPFALAAVAITAIVMFPATRRIGPVILPLAVASGLFALWWINRPAALAAELQWDGIQWERFDRPLDAIFASYTGPAAEQERRIVLGMTRMLGILTALSAVAYIASESWSRRNSREISWGVGVTLLPIVLAAGHLLAFSVLPMRIGEWWNVYPRELEAAVFMGLGVMPDLPRAALLRLPFVVGIVLSTAPMSRLVAREWREFHQLTADFRAIQRAVPPAPRLLYLVFDHRGSSKRFSPFVHLPAWLQAERGGWLSFHFAGWQMYPIRYREGSPQAPPPFEHDWEWNPQNFKVNHQGAWFDVFLVRAQADPLPLFKDDPSIRPVAGAGTWWLYERR